MAALSSTGNKKQLEFAATRARPWLPLRNSTSGYCAPTVAGASIVQRIRMVFSRVFFISSLRCLLMTKLHNNLNSPKQTAPFICVFSRFFVLLPYFVDLTSLYEKYPV